jgi:Txe/YoeB family toxin of Txe-Axe toxin-antitoxin module
MYKSPLSGPSKPEALRGNKSVFLRRRIDGNQRPAYGIKYERLYIFSKSDSGTTNNFSNFQRAIFCL